MFFKLICGQVYGNGSEEISKVEEHITTERLADKEEDNIGQPHPNNNNSDEKEEEDDGQSVLDLFIYISFFLNLLK